MSTEQLDLAVKIAAPEVSPAEIEALCIHLRGRGWVLSRDLLTETTIDDRTLRVIAEHSDGRIISGQKGYRLFDRTTPLEEADRAAAWLESQGKKMLLRGAAIRRRFHRYAREAKRA